MVGVQCVNKMTKHSLNIIQLTNKTNGVNRIINLI